MKNIDIIKKFVAGATAGKVGNLTIDGENLINYKTIIATRVAGGVALNVRKYSQTTSKIQNMIRNSANIVSVFEGADR